MKKGYDTSAKGKGTHWNIIFVAALVIIVLFCFSFDFKASEETSDTKNESIARQLASTKQTQLKSAKKELAPQLREPASPKNREEGIEFLQKKYGTRIHLDIDESNRPFTLIGNLKAKLEPGESEENFRARLISEMAPALEIDRTDQIVFQSQKAMPIGYVFQYDQVYRGVRVDSAQLRVHFGNNGDLIMVNSSYVNGVDAVDVVPKLTKDQAVSIAIRDSIDRYDPIKKRIANPNPPAELVIHRFQTKQSTDLTWKIAIFQPWLQNKRGAAHYFINAHSGEFERIEVARH